MHVRHSVRSARFIGFDANPTPCLVSTHAAHRSTCLVCQWIASVLHGHANSPQTCYVLENCYNRRSYYFLGCNDHSDNKKQNSTECSIYRSQRHESVIWRLCETPAKRSTALCIYLGWKRRFRQHMFPT